MTFTSRSLPTLFPKSTFALSLSLVLLTACTSELTDQQNSSASNTPVFEVPTLQGAKPWTDLNAEDAADDFHFVIVSDRTCCARPGVFAGAMPKVNLMSPAFVVSVGDLIEGYTENQTQLDREWDQMESFIGTLDAPFFYTPGNHDMNNAVMAETWQNRFGPSYYHFLYKEVLFVVINSELFGMVGQPDTPVPGPWQQSEQMEFVRSVLAQHPDPRWTIVLLHQPLWNSNNINQDWLEVEGLLGERDYTVFAGHFHQYSRVERHNRNFITLATTGGGSDLRGTAFGEFDHVAWVTMRDEGPRIANLLLDGIHDEDVSNPELLGALTNIGSSINIETTVAEGSLFSSTNQLVTIANPTDAPLAISPSIHRKANFEIDGLVPLTIPPGAQVQMSMRLSTTEQVPYHKLGTAAVQWVVTGTVNGRPAQFPVTKPVLPLAKYAIGAATGLTIDGDLSDWGSLTYSSNGQGDILAPLIDPADASFNFDVRSDNDNLYIAVEVTDDDVQDHAELIPRAQDSVRIFVDPRAPEERDQPMGAGAAVLGGDMAAQVATILPTGEATPDELLGFVAETNANIDYRIALTDNGYLAEVAIPLEYIASKAPNGNSWKEARISIGVYDLDGTAHGADVLHWQPYRYGSAALPGSQIFVRK
ncbi:MAG: hypothetical protein GKR90_16165 [Pseudomonadales bacterium]|nr:hypothetical protein [Pseudomonadales bacterium]